MTIIYLASISIELGKGALKHNSRIFNTSNTNPERSHLNKEYINDDIKNVYHKLFDEAVERYNSKQTRNDRKVKNYYEKICNGKQEKPFHEIVVQIGNKNDFGIDKQTAELAEKALDNYVCAFQKRNPYLRVFSAHMHLDEATPHLHIDFVPFTTGSKRGLDTRVSLKQALANQGFVGNGREETEWALWVNSEKESLAESMLKFNIEWENQHTNREHLSVLDYKKKERQKEVIQLEEKVDMLKNEIECYQDCSNELQEIDESDFDNKFVLPEPKPLMSANAYKKLIEPMFNKLKQMVKVLIVRCFKAEARAFNANRIVGRLQNDVEIYKKDAKSFSKMAHRADKKLAQYSKLRRIIGPKNVDEILKKSQPRNKERYR
ncbi:plasmid recombination protein [Ruminococcus sp.]|uniref:plasmid recombination protein n=1 Tax=Ruminococcus sp. TaxID=41978 RepID=UPI003AF4EE8A